ncbi:kinesin-like protein at 61F [Choristoneura fumiferana]|uniref:kinesin-like protein at 61F n=1 Tax=Choristoneura fumiferana TaxID=7141 RepID=UPI003D15AD6C
MTTEKGSRKDKNQNIQVFVRLRPLNQRERDIKSLGVVEVLNEREVVVRSHQSIHTKKFTFDQAFGPHAKQLEVYQQVVSPLIQEVLCGYNCTVFAYGQTGTGKTHTMVGENTGDEQDWQNDPLAGIIPRALSQLFDELRISNTEYTVRVSYLELYNEELFDLLSTSEDNSKLRIYEDVTRKGANIVNGLEEVTVLNKNHVYKIMAQGQERKRVASTLMNAQSSRSHTVFTIVVHMKENSPEGEELVKIGKLNLVDLAGSENISKAGSDNPAKRERARECVNINQSLLTLGRVITALVERHPHIPYRESKLTRILQESLGGRTKTSIIATISPGHKDLEETLSTLEYAHRAKNIQNKPEINQKMTKKAILKEFAEEIDKLKRDLQAARDKNGVYLANETFAEMTLKEEEQRKEIQELLLKKRAMEEERDRMEGVFGDLSQTLERHASELSTTKKAMETTKEQLANTKNTLKTTMQQYEEQKHLVSKHRATEEELSAQAKDIIAVADTAAGHLHCLHDSVDKRRTLESCNLQTTASFRQQAAQARARLAQRAQHFASDLAQAHTALHELNSNHTTTTAQNLEGSKQKLEDVVKKIVESMNEVKSSSAQAHSSLCGVAQQQRAALGQQLRAGGAGARAALAACVALAAAGARHLDSWAAPQTIASLVNQWLSDSLERVASLQRAHSTFNTAARDAETRRHDASRRQRDAKKQRVARAADRVGAALAQLETERTFREARISQQLADIELERSDAEARLARYMEEERRMLEERLARHAAAEREALEQRLAKRTADVEGERGMLDERIKDIETWRQELMAAVEHENQMADSDLAHCERGREESATHMDKFGTELVEGATAMSAELSAFSGNIVQVAEHCATQLLQLLAENSRQIEQEANTAIASEEESSKQLVARADEAFTSVVDNNKVALDAVLGRVEALISSTCTSVASVASSTSSLAADVSRVQAAHSSSLQSAQHQLEQFRAELERALQHQDDLERARLEEQFRVYSPTGKTPVRREYRFPRQLAATSPHERILARFRAARQNHEEECVVVESDPETSPPSDSESSVSEDSAVFPTPSPPAPPAQPICKSTSETDIYYRKAQPGKENTLYRPVSHKKTSRLPAPTSHKKPLVERNDN